MNATFTNPAGTMNDDDEGKIKSNDKQIAAIPL